MDANEQIALDSRTKLEFYFIALVFTVLGLSIQTGILEHGRHQYIFEIIAWSLLLLSGLAGLSRLEWVSPFYHHASIKIIEEIYADALRRHKMVLIDEDTEKPLTQDENKQVISKLDEQMTARSAQMKKMERSCEMKYAIHKWSFVFGLIFLIVSRICHGLNQGL